MSPPSFSDLGKKVKDLCSRQLPGGAIRCVAKLPLTNGVALGIDFSQKVSSGVLSATIDSKAPLKIGGRDFTWIEKWTAKNELFTNFEINSLKNFTNGIEIMYEPLNGQTTVKTKNSYKSEQLTASGDLKFKTYKPEISMSFMTNLFQAIPLQGGGSVTFDTKRQKMASMGYGIQLDKGEMCWSACVTNNAEFLSQMYLKLSDIWEVGIETGWNLDSKKSRFCGVTQFKIGSDSLIKYKIASCGLLSMGYSFKVLEAIQITLGMNLNTSNLTSGNHEVGIQIDL